jgi:P-type Ca2+ transporter type 2C
LASCKNNAQSNHEALNKLIPHHCHIIYDREQIHLLTNRLVPRDLITFTAGNRIPADVCLFTALDLDIDESSLTGETTEWRKGVAPCLNSTELAESVCVAYMGMLV